MVKTDKCMGVSEFFWGRALGLSAPKSTPMPPSVLLGYYSFAVYHYSTSICHLYLTSFSD